jgi:hypothetical protein
MSTPNSTGQSTPNAGPPAANNPDAAATDKPGTVKLSLRKLAAAIGVDAGQLSKESSRPGFPAGPLYDPAEVSAWRTLNVRQKTRRATPAPPPQVPAASPAVTVAAAIARAGEDDQFVGVLQSGNASALEISRAAVQILARNLARAHLQDVMGPNVVDGLKKSLQELRQGEADYIELEKSRRELLPRDEVRAIVGQCVARLVQVLSRIENAIAVEFSAWLADPQIAATPADQRARLVRGFVSKTAADIRRMEADQVDSLIDANLEKE